MSKLQGRIWLKKGERNFIGRGRVELLLKIGELGSISAAAKSMKMSYKSAWDSVDAMNNAAGCLLVEKSTGGKGGGSAKLTPCALRLVSLFQQIEIEHRLFLDKMEALIESSGF